MKFVAAVVEKFRRGLSVANGHQAYASRSMVVATSASRYGKLQRTRPVRYGGGQRVRIDRIPHRNAETHRQRPGRSSWEISSTIDPLYVRVNVPRNAPE